ncbi:MAG: acyl carrier protein [Tissierellales bacterium]|jgi:acyl carrier protein|nr:acyl carrier protein [Tissierellales bacterium]MBN2826546.1 acyl carrier protein [Tissierellales bacterium]
MTFEKVKAILAEELGLEDEIKLTDNLKDDLDADSLDLAEVVINLEEVFEIEIPEEDYPKFKTVKDIVDFIDAKIG